MKNIYLQIKHLCKSNPGPGIKPIVFFDIDNTFCLYSLDYSEKINHKFFILNILDLLEEENLYFVTSRSEDTKEVTITLLMETYCHPLIHKNTKIMFCRKHASNEIPKYKKVLELQEKFVPGTWVYFIDDIDFHVECMYHALKHHRIDFVCFLFDDRKVEKADYIDITRGNDLVYVPPTEFIDKNVV